MEQPSACIESQNGIAITQMVAELGARLIQTETELVLKSRWVIPTDSARQDFIVHMIR